MYDIRHTNKKRAVIAIGISSVAILLGCLYFAWGNPPQIGPDEEVFSGVDALFTAVTAHDERLLDQCARRLTGLAEAKKIPEEAWTYLGGIIAKARAGRWQSSAESLYGFMLAQRREGAVGHSRKKQPHGQRVAHRK